MPGCYLPAFMIARSMRCAGASAYSKQPTAGQRCMINSKVLVREAWATGLVAEIIIDGSFVTAKPDPNDIDLILVLNAGHDFSTELRPFEYNVLSRRQARKIYGFDLLVAMAASAVYAEYLAFFAQVRGETSRRKGLLRLRHDQK